MSAQYQGTEEFRDATFRDCDLSGVRIVSSFVDGLWIGGFDGRAGRIVVDDVDVSEYVSAELDRRCPERVQFRAAESLDDYRALWATLDELWTGTVARAGALTEQQRQERADGEWSFVETLRHMVFGIDIWVGRMLNGEKMPWHPLGLGATDISPQSAARMGLDPDAKPSFAEILGVYDGRRAKVREAFAVATDLAEPVAQPLPGAENESHTVGSCLKVVLHEHLQHRRYAERDLARISEGG
jgi:hypothetical protein